jgi:hypothetical protein
MAVLKLITLPNVHTDKPRDLQQFDGDLEPADDIDPEFRREMFQIFRSEGGNQRT